MKIRTAGTAAAVLTWACVASSTPATALPPDLAVTATAYTSFVNAVSVIDERMTRTQAGVATASTFVNDFQDWPTNTSATFSEIGDGIALAGTNNGPAGGSYAVTNIIEFVFHNASTADTWLIDLRAEASAYSWSGSGTSCVAPFVGDCNDHDISTWFQVLAYGDQGTMFHDFGQLSALSSVLGDGGLGNSYGQPQSFDVAATETMALGPGSTGQLRVRRDTDLLPFSAGGTYDAALSITLVDVRLQTTPVPAPAALPLALAGLATLAAFARRRGSSRFGGRPGGFDRPAARRPLDRDDARGGS